MKVTYSFELEDLADRAIKARTRMGLTQLELSDISEISIKTIQGIEQGRRGMSEKTLNALCKAYRLTPNQFLFGVDFFPKNSYSE
jgi:transcriptional regulator with XRE-family HTH domain